MTTIVSVVILVYIALLALFTALPARKYHWSMALVRTGIIIVSVVIAVPVAQAIAGSLAGMISPMVEDMLGGGDMVGTVDDVYVLNRAVKHRLLLKSGTWEQVLTPSPLNNKGLGCTVTQWHGKKRITHNGGNQGFRSLHIHLPEDDFDIIILSNCGFHNPGRSDKAELIYSTFYDSLAKAEKPVDMDTGYI